MSNVVGSVFGAIGKVFSFLTPKLPDTVVGKLDDLTVQTSTYGTDIPRLDGTVAISGNVIWLENGKLKEVVKKKKSGGKGGGGGSETKTYTYFATFALALCEGPIAGIRRIWCSDKLIYNAGSDDLETIIASNKAAEGFTIYLGSDDQLPDPRYEADVGVGNAPAYRGLAYIVLRDFALADYSNTLQGAQFKVEVVSAGIAPRRLLREIENPIGTPSWTSCSNPAADSPVVFAATWSGSYAFPITVRCYRYESGQAKLVKQEQLPGFNGSYANSSFAVGQSSGAPCILNTSGAGASSKYNLSVFSGSSFSFYSVEPGANLGFTQARFYLVGDSIFLASTSASTGIRRCDKSNLGIYELKRINANGRFYESISVFDSLVYAARYQSNLIDVFSPDLEFIETLPSVPGSDNVYHVNGTEYGVVAIKFASNDAYVFDGEAWYLSQADVTELYQLRNSFIGSIHYNPRNKFTSAYIVKDGVGPLLAIANPFDGVGIPVADVISSEVRQANLITTSDIDVSTLTSTLSGYRVTGGSIRSALEPLQTYSPFDVVQSGYKIKFVPRGNESVITIPYSDLYAGDDGLGTVLEQPREMDSQLPSKTTIKYLDASREYAVSSQYYQRTSTQSVNAVETELAIVMTADDAAKVAEIQTFRAWLERTTSSFSLPPTYLPLEPGDVITIDAPDAQYELRLAETNMTPEGRLECKAAPNRAALYTSNAVGGEVPGPDGTIGLAGVSVFIPLDIPVVDETVQNDVGFVGVMTGYSNGWPGALLVRSNDEGQTFTDLQAFQGKATLGYVRGVLPASSGTLIDQRTLVVDLISGELDGVTQDQMLSGANYAAYGADQRWEIVRFQNAVLQPDGSYALSGFVRGERGTEWATGLHAVGDAFVLLDDPDNAFINAPVESIGLNRLYRGVTAGDPVDEATDVNFAYRGVNLETLSPVYPSATRDSAGNLTGSFTRRSRLSSSWWTTGVAAPVGETAEAYEIDVMSGTTVKRTLAVSSPSFVYTAEQQTADFGSAQAAITFRIYQLSSVVGRGYPLEVTL